MCSNSFYRFKIVLCPMNYPVLGAIIDVFQSDINIRSKTKVRILEETKLERLHRETSHYHFKALFKARFSEK